MLSRSLPRTLGVGTLLVGGLLAASPACSGTPSFDGSDEGTGGAGGPCPVAGVTGCGESCTGDNQCSTGLFCDTESNKCDAECVAGTTSSPECDGAPCAANGRCIGGATGGTTGAGGGGIDPGPSSGGGGGEGGGTSCIDVEVTPTPIIPNVVLLMDRSLSMTGATGYMQRVQDAITAGEYTPWDCTGPVAGGPGGSGDAEFWRWNVVRTALFNPDDGVVTTLGDVVRFGLTTYSSDEATFGTCPTLVDVDLAFDNRDAMLASFACSDLILQTPTRESLAPTADAFAALAVDGPKFIILATDGAPDNCECPDFTGAAPCSDPGAQEAEQAAVVAEATRVHNELGITLHVIDVSSPSETALAAHLAEVAAAGGGDKYDGTDPAGLIDAFETIIADAQSCVITLDGSIVAGYEDDGKVTLGGEELEYEVDWQVNSPSEIELLGEACTTFKREAPTLSVKFPCNAIVVK